MVRLYFYVEGQTEQEYVARVLRPHLANFGVWVMGSVLAASGRKHGHTSRGGGRRYQPMRKDLGNLLARMRMPTLASRPCSTCTHCTTVFLAGTTPKSSGTFPMRGLRYWREHLLSMSVIDDSYRTSSFTSSRRSFF